MTVTVKINIDNQAGKKLISDLRQHPEVVEFIEHEEVSGNIPESYVDLKEGFDMVREHVNSVYKKMENDSDK
ncbi:MAG: hypothetical protein H6Q20_1184 [Bacteroidetes bacterium]|jgi:hypothetical protein|nr:hypothetical protein [Bacteroidota bacterium]